MKNVKFSKEMLALLSSVILRLFYNLIFDYAEVFVLPGLVATFILVMWSVIDLVLVYKVAVLLAGKKDQKSSL